VSEDYVTPLSGMEIVARRHARDRARYSVTHDEQFHEVGDFIEAAECYLMPPGRRKLMEKTGVPVIWPWSRKDWHPEDGDRIAELAKAASLIVSEIDRLQRVGERDRLARGEWHRPTLEVE
jgi:hypothetical protein